jgi:hypothetical protein
MRAVDGLIAVAVRLSPGGTVNGIAVVAATGASESAAVPTQKQGAWRSERFLPHQLRDGLSDSFPVSRLQAFNAGRIFDRLSNL